MAFEKLTEQEQRLILEAMTAILNGPYIDDAEFQTRLGIDRLQLREVLDTWPVIEDDNEDSHACIAINNCMNEVCYGIEISSAAWSKWFTAPRSDVAAVYARWAKLKGYHATGIH